MHGNIAAREYVRCLRNVKLAQSVEERHRLATIATEQGEYLGEGVAQALQGVEGVTIATDSDCNVVSVQVAR